MTDENKKGSKGSGGEFFALDYDAWPAVCGLGQNAAVAYVVLARFTMRDNTHTAASVQAIEKYTGMARIRAQEAINALINARLVERVPESPRTRPRYILRSWHDAHPDVKGRKACFYNVLGRLGQLGTYSRKAWPTLDSDVADARDAGLILHSGKSSWKANDPSAERNLVWMPNAFVSGTSAGEVPPLRRLRETGTVDALRLVIDLYATHHLADDGGVSPRVVWQPWERHVIATTEHHNILGFTQPKQEDGQFIGGKFNVESRAWNGFEAIGSKAWDSMHAVERLGLVEVVTTLFDGPEGEPMFPINHEPASTSTDAVLINRCGLAAHMAAETWGGAAVQKWWGDHPGDKHLLMAHRHVQNATLRGIYRLRYRPHTKATARWWGKLVNVTEAWVAKFNELAQHPQHDRRTG